MPLLASSATVRARDTLAGVTSRAVEKGESEGVMLPDDPADARAAHDTRGGAHDARDIPPST